MKSISDSDYDTIVRCLGDYIRTPDDGSNRSFNMRRKAKLILRKFTSKNGELRKTKERHTRVAVARPSEMEVVHRPAFHGRNEGLGHRNERTGDADDESACKEVGNERDERVEVLA